MAKLKYFTENRIKSGQSRTSITIGFWRQQKWGEIHITQVSVAQESTDLTLIWCWVCQMYTVYLVPLLQHCFLRCCVTVLMMIWAKLQIIKCLFYVTPVTFCELQHVLWIKLQLNLLISISVLMETIPCICFHLLCVKSVFSQILFSQVPKITVVMKGSFGPSSYALVSYNWFYLAYVLLHQHN